MEAIVPLGLWCETVKFLDSEVAADGNKLAGRLLDAMLALFLPLLALFAFRGQTLFATALLVASMGALGGFLSRHRRTPTVHVQDGPLLATLKSNGQFPVILAPLIGAICAVLLFLAFLGGLLKGTLFPDLTKFHFSFGKTEPPALESGHYGPYSLLLLWSFIAGFAARLVPATLHHRARTGWKVTTAQTADAPDLGQQSKRTQLKHANYEARRGIHRVI